MKNLIDDIGSVKHNLSQKIKASVTDKASMLEINGHQLYLEDTISEGRKGLIRGLWLHHSLHRPLNREEVRLEEKRVSGRLLLTRTKRGSRWPWPSASSW